MAEGGGVAASGDSDATATPPTAGPLSRQRGGDRSAPARPRVLIASALAAGLALFAAPSAFAATPTPTIDPVLGHSITTAHVKGSIDVPPDANETYFGFETSTDGLTWSPFTYEGPISPGSGPTTVSTVIHGLSAATTYEVRLVALNFEEFIEQPSTEVQTFTTDPAPNAPSVSLETPEGVSYTTAQIKGSFNPEQGNEDPIDGAIPITGQLQIRPEGGEWASVGDPLTLENAEALSEDDFPLQAELTELQNGQRYDFRLLVTYAGLQASEEGEFETKAVAKPTVSLEAPSLTNSQKMSYFFAGHVDPDAPKAESELEGTEPEEEAIKAAFATHWSFSCEPGCPGREGDLTADDTSHLVTDEVGLEPNTAYTLTLHASNLGGETTASRTFKTPQAAPIVATGTNTPEGDEEVTLRGYVNPRNTTVTACAFEYGPTSAYGQSLPCEGDPNGLGEGFGGAPPPATVTAHLTALNPGATYHFRVVATNAAGTSESPDASFETQSPYQPPSNCPNQARRVEQHSTFLPDCRAYEQVSPADKNGGEVTADSTRDSVAADGSAATFGSQAAFGDALSTIISTDYLSVRGTAGWSTHAISPPQAPIEVPELLRELEPRYMAFSADLSKGIYRGLSPVTDDPDVANVPDLYLREDARAAGPGSYALLSSCPLCEAPGGHPLPPGPGDPNAVPESGAQPRFAGASADFGKIAFESQQPLVESFPGEDCSVLKDQLVACPGKLYESDHGTLRLTGLVPPSPETEAECTSTCVPSAEGSQAGQGAGSFQGTTMFSPHIVSSDGSRVFFTVPSAPREHIGALYMREDGARTVRLDVSEREGAQDVPSTEPAAYWDASADGSRVFFTSNAALTSDASAGGVGGTGGNLYMYDLDAPAGHHLTLISADQVPADGSGAVQTVLGTSSDGNYVYFSAVGQLVAGQPFTDRAIYVWHDGTLRYIAATTGNAENTDAYEVPGFFFTTARVTPDGSRLIFSSTQQPVGPTGYDQGSCAGLGGCREFYLYEYADQRLSCATCNPEADKPSTSAFIGNFGASGISAHTPVQPHALSDDGRHFFFSTLEALVPQDTDGATDAYSYDARSGTLHLISSGTSAYDSIFMNASSDGSNVFFLSREKLTGTDIDSAYDLYDAREAGGFPEPPPSDEICEGESCQGNPKPQPSSPTPGSGSVIGTENPEARHRCPRGKVRRHGLCLIKKSHRARHHKRGVAQNLGGQK